MSDKNTGGPAFPVQHHLNHGGMALRDYFAAKAMSGIITDPNRNLISVKECARLSYLMADEMLKAREA